MDIVNRLHGADSHEVCSKGEGMDLEVMQSGNNAMFATASPSSEIRLTHLELI